jgi:hypothetical protein
LYLANEFWQFEKLNDQEKQYIDHRQKQLIRKAQDGEILSEEEKQQYRKLFTKQS